MALDTHLETLKQRHTALEDEIVAARLKPAVSDAEIQELKRRKLQLKDEMERLRSSRD